jgi:hypothetical protein
MAFLVYRKFLLSKNQVEADNALIEADNALIEADNALILEKAICHAKGIQS